MSVERVIAVIRAELGYTENPPGSNRTKYGEAYGWNGMPWCMQFLWWCFREAGEAGAFFGGGKTASCGTLLRWYREQGQVVPTADVQPGDIVILNFLGTQETQHCGLVVDVQTSLLLSEPRIPTIDAVITIEGNTTSRKNGGQNCGGMVCEKNRYPSQIVAVCRPQYTEDPPTPDYVGHWAESAMRWGIESGLIKGYDDGTFRPDGTVTRGELMTILQRLRSLK